MLQIIWQGPYSPSLCHFAKRWSTFKILLPFPWDSRFWIVIIPSQVKMCLYQLSYIVPMTKAKPIWALHLVFPWRESGTCRSPDREIGMRGFSQCESTVCWSLPLLEWDSSWVLQRAKEGCLGCHLDEMGYLGPIQGEIGIFGSYPGWDWDIWVLSWVRLGYLGPIQR